MRGYGEGEPDAKEQRMDSSQGSQKAGASHDTGFQEAHDAFQPGQMCPEPPGSTWFKARIAGKGPQEQMFEHAKQNDHKFMAAFDYAAHDGQRVVKMYASYPSCEDFVRGSLLKTDRKHFYELIPEETPCKLYLDVEWIGTHSQEEAVQVVHCLVEELKAFTQVRACCTDAYQKITKTDFSDALIFIQSGRVFLVFCCRNVTVICLQEQAQPVPPLSGFGSLSEGYI